MGAAASVAMVAAPAVMSLPAAGIFAAGVAVGAAFGPKAAGDDVVSDGLNSVYAAAEAVITYVRIALSAYEKVKKAEAFVKDGVVNPVCDKASSATDYLRTAASSAFEQLKAAAAFVKDKVIKLVRHLLGDKEAAAARREVDDAAAQDAVHDVLSRASARAPPSSAIVPATAPGGALALQGSVSALAARAARRASEMMALLKDAFRALRDGITGAARSCVSGVVAAVGICLEAIGIGGVAAKVA